MTIKYKQLRAQELRRIADMIENSEVIKALTIGISLDLGVYLGEASPSTLTYWAGDQEQAFDLMRQGTRRLPEGSPYAIKTDLPEGESKVLVQSEVDEESDHDVLEMVDDMIKVLQAVQQLVK